MKPPSTEEAVGVTSVFWDMTRCPVPCDFDARLVGPCITRFLENLGYSGRITIAAFGVLTEFYEHILRAISSTWVTLTHCFDGKSSHPYSFLE